MSASYRTFERLRSRTTSEPKQSQKATKSLKYKTTPHFWEADVLRSGTPFGIGGFVPPQPIFLYLNQIFTGGAPTSRPMGCGTPVVRKACRRDAATEQGVSSKRRDALNLE